MAEKDLIPASKRTKEEAKELGRLGGIKSGEARRNKRDLKARLEAALQIAAKADKKKIKQILESGFIKDKQEIVPLNEELRQELEADLELLEEGWDVLHMVKIIRSNKTGAVAKKMTLDSIHDRLEGKPSQKTSIEHSGAMTTKIIRDDIK